MSSERDGRPGNRPASVPEIEKLPRTRCARCGLRGPTAMVENGQCVNRHACFRRVARARREAAKIGPLPPEAK